jgi:hypothetical protein
MSNVVHIFGGGGAGAEAGNRADLILWCEREEGKRGRPWPEGPSPWIRRKDEPTMEISPGVGVGVFRFGRKRLQLLRWKCPWTINAETKRLKESVNCVICRISEHLFAGGIITSRRRLQPPLSCQQLTVSPPLDAAWTSSRLVSERFFVGSFVRELMCYCSMECMHEWFGKETCLCSIGTELEPVFLWLPGPDGHLKGPSSLESGANLRWVTTRSS